MNTRRHFIAGSAAVAASVTAGIPLGAFAQAMAVIVDQEQRGARLAVGIVGRRHEILAVLGEQLGPFLELPGIEQGRLLDEKVLGVGAGERHGHHGPVSSREGSPATSCRQRRQKVRICNSSVLVGALLSMPRERSL